MARKTKEEAEKTRQRILAAAEAIFAEVGYEGASLGDIAKSARVPKSLIHHYFPSKERLWDVVRFSIFSRYRDEQLATLSADEGGSQFVRRSCAAYFRFLQEHPAFLRMLYWNQAERGVSFEPEHDKDTHAVARDLVEEGAARIRHLQATGGMRKDLDPRMLIGCFLGLLRQWFVVRQDYFSESTTNPAALDDEYLHTVITLFWEGVRPPEAKTP